MGRRRRRPRGRTDDGGLSWRRVSPKRLASEDLSNIVFLDGSRGLAVGSRGRILFTSSGGKNWTVRPSPTTARLNAMDFVDQKQGWIVGDKGTILRSVNGGITWSQVVVEIREDLFGIDFVSSQQGWIVGARGAILRTKRWR